MTTDEANRRVQHIRMIVLVRARQLTHEPIADGNELIPEMSPFRVRFLAASLSANLRRAGYAVSVTALHVKSAETWDDIIAGIIKRLPSTPTSPGDSGGHPKQDRKKEKKPNR
jgi:hypothetical protein